MGLGRLKTISTIEHSTEAIEQRSLAIRRVIVNADGFGFGRGATQGIITALRGTPLVSSISVNANFPDVECLGSIAAEFPKISIGVHLNTMVGRPCLPPSDVPTLVDSEGNFCNRRFLSRLRLGIVSKEQLEAELDAQILTVKSIVGERLTHLDSQGHSHLAFFNTFLRVARKWGLTRMRNNAPLICMESPNPQSSRRKLYFKKPHVWLMHMYRRSHMRTARARGMRMPDHLITVGYAGLGNKTNMENWVRILTNLPPGTSEIYCHPGYPDDTLHKWSYYCNERLRELEIIQNPTLMGVIRNLGIQQVSYRSI